MTTRDLLYYLSYLPEASFAVFGVVSAWRRLGDWRRKLASTAVQVPRAGEQIILLVCPADRGEWIAGDLQERHARLATRHGLRFANVWYWSQVARSAGPLLWAAVWRMVAVKELMKRLWP